MARRPRGLSAEDRALWDRVAQTLTPIDRQRVSKPAEPKPAPPRGPDRPADPHAARLPQQGRPPSPRVTTDLAPDPMDTLRRSAPAMDAKTFARMRRGRLQPEARIDLHGMTAERAHGRLQSFIADAHARGLRLVLVITGKGRAGPDDSPARRGVLRSALPHWLSQPPLRGMVLQIAPAHDRHGGGGAYYVYLRRGR